MKKDITYICHIIESIELIESYTKEGKEVFEKDHKTYDAVLRQLQIMSESTQKLNKAVKEKYSHIPWSEISGFRNKLTHDYLQGIDTNIIWGITYIKSQNARKHN